MISGSDNGRGRVTALIGFKLNYCGQLEHHDGQLPFPEVPKVIHEFLATFTLAVSYAKDSSILR